MSAPQLPSQRAISFARARLIELCASESAPSRSAPTLSTRAALEEALALADARLRSGGVTRPGADPANAGHGVSTLPEVVEEALSLISSDHVIKRASGSLIDPLRKSVERLRADDVTQGDIEKTRGFANRLFATFIEDAFALIREIAVDRPKALSELEVACEQLAADLQARGWSSETLSSEVEQLSDAPDSFLASLERLCDVFLRPAREFLCYVPVLASRLREPIPQDVLKVVDAITGPIPAGAPLKGPFAELRVVAHDGRVAAEIANGRASSVLRAVALFVSPDIGVRSTVVIVDDGGVRSRVNLSVGLRREPRFATPGQVSRIARSALAATQMESSDAVFDAIRHRDRGLESTDVESRFMLLWLGIERLVAGSRDFARILEAARTIVPKSIALGKIRRDIAGLASALDEAPFSDDQRTALLSLVGHGEVVDREKLLRRLLSKKAESDELTTVFYESAPLLVQRYWGVRDGLSEGDGPKIAAYVERSRLRIEYQVLRLYRARNSVAHAARGPAWINDLVRHANHYLTQLIAIVVHYRESSPTRPVADILAARGGHFDAFLELLRRNDPAATAPKALLRPTSIVGRPSELDR